MLETWADAKLKSFASVLREWAFTNARTQTALPIEKNKIAIISSIKNRLDLLLFRVLMELSLLYYDSMLEAEPLLRCKRQDTGAEPESAAFTRINPSSSSTENVSTSRICSPCSLENPVPSFTTSSQSQPS